MQRLIQIRLFAAVLGSSTAIHVAALARAQVETIDPNPTMPRDVGGRLTYRGSSSGGPRLGRATAREENPAETLLKSIDGTNYGRNTGHSLFSDAVEPRAVNRGARRHLRRPNPTETMWFSERGAYEDRVYSPATGSYRSSGRQQTYYRAQPAEPRRQATTKAVAKPRSGQRTTKSTK